MNWINQSTAPWEPGPSSRNLRDRQRVAVVGAGISGLASAYFLSRRYEVTLYESARVLGGHSHTVDVRHEGVSFPVDTGFLVYNERTYPNLVRLFEELGVAAHPSEMSFGVSIDGGQTEWSGTDLSSVFAQRRHLLSPRFLGMLSQILRFNRAAVANLERACQASLTLGELLDECGYGSTFRDAYLLPMAAAIWSSARHDILRFPAETFLRFTLNHGLLQLRDRPQWLTVDGGSRNYVLRLSRRLQDVRVGTPVRAVHREGTKVVVGTDASAEKFDALVFATHAPDTLRLLTDARDDERALLARIRYQPNHAVLHRDPQLLPRRRSVWSAWNYLGGTGVGAERPVCVSYLINKLQPLPTLDPVVVTLNPITEPNPALELGRYVFDHPVLDQPAIAAQRELPAVQGRHRVWFAGAWTGYGFHEDGLNSALRVARHFGSAPAWAVA